jgi:ATP-dependent protease ClpP protease subunit
MKTWFKFNAKADPAAVDIDVIDFIGDWVDDFFGFGVTAKSFVAELERLGPEVKTIRVHINSPGGDVFGALNIANALREQSAKGRKVETIVDGLAASAATLVMMAGDVIRIADNGIVMIHNPWTVAMGDSSEFRKNADVLDKIRDSIIATYQWHVDMPQDELIALMQAETWMDADQAIELGFADEKIATGRAVAASFDPSRLARFSVPEKHVARLRALFPESAPEPPINIDILVTAAEVLSLCVNAGLNDAELAKKICEEELTTEQACARVESEAALRNEERARVEGVRALCQKFTPAFSEDLVASGISVSGAKKIVLRVTAMVDKAELDTSLTASQGVGTKARINVREVYAARNSR